MAEIPFIKQALYGAGVMEQTCDYAAYEILDYLSQLENQD